MYREVGWRGKKLEMEGIFQPTRENISKNNKSINISFE